MNTIRDLTQYASILSVAAILAACGGGGGGATSGSQGGGGTPDTPPSTYSVAGTISGLTASGLELNLAGGSVSEAHSPTQEHLILPLLQY